MAPELFIASEDDAHVTEKVDLFSFGITLWELWTGKLPYEGLSDFSIMDGVRSGTLRPQIPESCHPTLAALMQVLIIEIQQDCWVPIIFVCVRDSKANSRVFSAPL